jgi:hypothetical protein
MQGTGGGSRMNSRDYEVLEQLYLNLCDVVHKDALRIFGIAGNGRSDDAANAAADLAQMAKTCKNQYHMRKEVQGNYDLTTLRVDTTAGSNSETGWERED